MQVVGVEPTQLTLPDLETGSLDHSDILAWKLISLVVITSFDHLDTAPFLERARFEPAKLSR